MLSLMRTRKTFHNVASSRLRLLGYPLRFESTSTTSYTKTLAFISRVKENPSEFEHVKHLSIVNIPGLDNLPVANFAMDAIHKGKDLEFLNVFVLVSKIPAQEKDDCKFFKPIPLPSPEPASCPKLKHLIVRNLDDHVVKMLQRLDAPLKSANISFYPDWMRPPDVEPIIYLLQKFAATLEEFQVSDDEWSDNVIPITFPRLHAPALRNASLGGIGNIVRAFPNLKTLVHPCTASTNLSAERTYEVNLAIMKTLQESCVMWTSLDFLQISAHALYHFALQCPVKHFDLRTQNTFITSPIGIDDIQTMVNGIQDSNSLFQISLLIRFENMNLTVSTKSYHIQP